MWVERISTIALLSHTSVLIIPVQHLSLHGAVLEGGPRRRSKVTRVHIDVSSLNSCFCPTRFCSGVSVALLGLYLRASVTQRRWENHKLWKHSFINRGEEMWPCRVTIASPETPDFCVLHAGHTHTHTELGLFGCFFQTGYRSKPWCEQTLDLWQIKLGIVHLCLVDWSSRKFKKAKFSRGSILLPKDVIKNRLGGRRRGQKYGESWNYEGKRWKWEKLKR